VVEVLRRYSEWQVVVNQNLVEMGFDFLWSYDDIAFRSGLFCSKRTFMQVLYPALQVVAESITIPWVFHSDGNIMSVVEELIDLGISGLHPIEPGPMDLAVVKERYGDRLCIIGNVSVDALSASTPADIDEIVRQCILTAGKGGGYMISSANSVPAYAKPENVVAMAEAIRKYGRYPITV
jgi:uroporphyrinogen decarboxylase